MTLDVGPDLVLLDRRPRGAAARDEGRLAGDARRSDVGERLGDVVGAVGGDAGAVSDTLSTLAASPAAGLAERYGLTQCASASGTAVS